MKFFIIVFLFSLIACGKSPLLKQKEVVAGSSSLETSKILSSVNLKLNLHWITPINSTQEAKAILLVTKDKLATDLPQEFSLFLWMPSMGHGSSPISVTKLATGVYQLSEVYFIMEGIWQLKIQLKKANSITDEVQFEYSL